MKKVHTIAPITDVRRDAATLLRQLRASKEPVVITQRGRAVAVLMSAEAYERSEHDRALLRLLARGEKAIAPGKGHRLDAVLTEAAVLLAGGKR